MIKTKENSGSGQKMQTSQCDVFAFRLLQTFNVFMYPSNMKRKSY